MPVDSDIAAMMKRDHTFATGNTSSILVYNPPDTGIDTLTITGVRGPEFESNEVNEEGIFIRKEFKAVYRVDHFNGGTLPVQKTVVIVDGVNVFVKDFELSPGDVVVEYTYGRDS